MGNGEIVGAAVGIGVVRVAVGTWVGGNGVGVDGNGVAVITMTYGAGGTGAQPMARTIVPSRKSEMRFIIPLQFWIYPTPEAEDVASCITRC